MEPDGRPGPRWHLDGRVPHCGHGVDIYRASQGCDCVASTRVSHCQRLAAIEVVRPGWRPACGVDPLQGGYESRQISRRLEWVGYTLDSRVLALEPPVEIGRASCR